MPQTKHDTDSAFARWLAAATPEIINRFTVLAKTSAATYRQWLSSRRNLSAKKAAVVEAAMKELEAEFPDCPAALTRGELCDVCSKCPYYLASRNADKSDS